jgi:hypothetical protein
MYALGVFHPIVHLPCPIGLDTNCVPYRSTQFFAVYPLTKCISISCFYLSSTFTVLVTSPFALHLDPVRRPV